ALEPLAVSLVLVLANEAAVAAVERKARTTVDLVLHAAPERLHDLVLARHDLCHIHFDLAQMNAELRCDSRVVRDPGAGDHRLGRRAAVIDTRSADIGLLDQCHRPALIREIGCKRHAALARAEEDCTVGFNASLPDAGHLRSAAGSPLLASIPPVLPPPEMLMNDRHHSRPLLDLARLNGPNQKPTSAQAADRVRGMTKPKALMCGPGSIDRREGSDSAGGKGANP